jgi:glycosyltransferase involved in cell wall biosynthesis
VTHQRLVHVTTTDISLALLLGPQLRAFQRAGYETIGVSAPGPYAAQLEEWGIRHVPLRYATRAMAPHRDVAALAELRRVFMQLHPTIVHTHNPKPGVYGRLAARAARVPAIVNTVHGLYAQPEDPLPRRALVYGLERVASTCSHAELLQNMEDIPVLRRLGVPARKLRLLGNGVDLDRFDPEHIDPSRRKLLRREWGIADDAVVCGVVGRLVWEKGYREVFAAAAQLRSRMPDLHFVVIGPLDGDKADSISQLDMARATRDANIVFAGERHDIDHCYSAFDLYALASYREGFPRSAMEAAAMGLPIVATDIRGCRQVVEHGTTGTLVPVHDVDRLARAVEELGRDVSRRARYGEAARAKARREFDQQRCIDITLGVYTELLARRVARRPAPIRGALS